MATAEQLITDNLDIWASAVQMKSASGRGKSNKRELYGVKKLRELIIDLAVRGLLVPQDPNDEPATELLKKIAADKAQLVNNGKIRKQKALPPVGEDEQDFDLPTGWEWCRLADTAYSQAGFAFKSKGFNESGDGLPLIRIRDVGQPFSGTFYDGEYREELVVRDGDYLISMDGNFRVAPWEGPEALLNQRVSRLIFFGDLLAQRFIAEFLQLRLSALQGVKAYTTVDHLSGGQISSSVIALPPSSEQFRIVAKVDELMALCDQLEQQQEASITAHQTLVSTLLDALTTATERDGFTVAWARIANHFDTLFTTEWSIDQLKQTILQLAVMGKLVPQDPNDEPASELLKKIAAEKAKLVKEGTIKKQKALPPVTEGEKSFDLPESWALERVGNLTQKLGSGSTPRGGRNAYVDSGIPFLRSQNVWNDGLKLDDIAYISPETHERMSNTKVYPGDVLLNITGASLGRSTIFPADIDEGNVSQHVTIVRLIEPAMNRFVRLGILSPMIQQLVWGRQVGMAIEGLSKKVFENFEFPIPPLEEQARIVAKVDELMILCDALKAKINEARSTQIHLANALASSAVM